MCKNKFVNDFVVNRETTLDLITHFNTWMQIHKGVHKSEKQKSNLGQKQTNKLTVFFRSFYSTSSLG